MLSAQRVSAGASVACTGDGVAGVSASWRRRCGVGDLCRISEGARDQICGWLAKPLPMMGPVGFPVGEPPAGSSVIS